MHKWGQLAINQLAVGSDMVQRTETLAVQISTNQHVSQDNQDCLAKLYTPPPVLVESLLIPDIPWASQFILESPVYSWGQSIPDPYYYFITLFSVIFITNILLN